jgi:hypothetical protein
LIGKFKIEFDNIANKNPVIKSFVILSVSEGPRWLFAESLILSTAFLVQDKAF